MLADLPFAIQVKACELECVVGYTDYQNSQRLIERYDGSIIAENFAERVSLQIQIPLSNKPDFERSLRDLTSGTAIIHTLKPEVFVLRPA